MGPLFRVGLDGSQDLVVETTVYDPSEIWIELGLVELDLDGEFKFREDMPEAAANSRSAVDFEPVNYFFGEDDGDGSLTPAGSGGFPVGDTSLESGIEQQYQTDSFDYTFL